MSRPSTAPASRGRIEQPVRVERIQRQEATLESKDEVAPINGAEIEEASSVHEEEQGDYSTVKCLNPPGGNVIV